MSIHVQLHQFEGPLALLLYLIRKEEMDILNINIHQITAQYLEYIQKMRELDLEVAGDFVAMAATLIHIKSRMLLPQYDEQGDAMEQDDPRKELVQKLLEYKRFQEASKTLYDRPLLGRDLWIRGHREVHISDDESEIILDDSGLFGMIASYRRAVRRMKTNVHNVMANTQSIASRVLEISNVLKMGQRLLLSSLLDKKQDQSERYQLLITFLSVLELAKMGFVRLFQNENFGDIHITPEKPIEGNVIERVEEYDSVDSENLANAIMDQAEFAADLEASDEDRRAREEAEEDAILAATDDEIDAAEAELDRGDREPEPELAEV